MGFSEVECIGATRVRMEVQVLEKRYRRFLFGGKSPMEQPLGMRSTLDARDGLVQLRFKVKTALCLYPIGSRNFMAFGGFKIGACSLLRELSGG